MREIDYGSSSDSLVDEGSLSDESRCDEESPLSPEMQALERECTLWGPDYEIGRPDNHGFEIWCPSEMCIPHVYADVSQENHGGPIRLECAFCNMLVIQETLARDNLAYQIKQHIDTVFKTFVDGPLVEFIIKWYQRHWGSMSLTQESNSALSLVTVRDNSRVEVRVACFRKNDDDDDEYELEITYRSQQAVGLPLIERGRTEFRVTKDTSIDEIIGSIVARVADI